MQINVSVDERLINKSELPQISEIINESLLIRKYEKGEFSIGELQEMLGFQYREEVHNWLSVRNVATIKEMTDTLEEIATKNALELEKPKKQNKDLPPWKQTILNGAGLWENREDTPDIEKIRKEANPKGA